MPGELEKLSLFFSFQFKVDHPLSGGVRGHLSIAHQVTATESQIGFQHNLLPGHRLVGPRVGPLTIVVLVGAGRGIARRDQAELEHGSALQDFQHAVRVFDARKLHDDFVVPLFLDDRFTYVTHGVEAAVYDVFDRLGCPRLDKNRFDRADADFKCREGAFDKALSKLELDIHFPLLSSFGTDQ